jgi:hypothetical protein
MLVVNRLLARKVKSIGLKTIPETYPNARGLASEIVITCPWFPPPLVYTYLVIVYRYNMSVLSSTLSLHVASHLH